MKKIIVLLLITACNLSLVFSQQFFTEAYTVENVQQSNQRKVASASNETFPANPTADIVWIGGNTTVAQIQTAFNNARTAENNQLGISLPNIVFPTQTVWDAKSDNEKLLWLINKERTARSCLALENFETNVTEVATSYANYLVNNNTSGHSADGKDPWTRLNKKPAISSCHDFLSRAENIAYFVSSINNLQSIIELSFYNWMYVDMTSSWGHRIAILLKDYTNNRGSVSTEGFVGVCRVSTTNYKGPFSSTWAFAQVVVMNIFDPCPSFVVTGISTNTDEKLNIKLYPNPVIDKLHIEYKSNSVENITVQINSLEGKRVITKQMSALTGQNRFEINTSSLNEGIYVLNIYSNSNLTHVYKLVKN